MAILINTKEDLGGKNVIINQSENVPFSHTRQNTLLFSYKSLCLMQGRNKNKHMAIPIHDNESPGARQYHASCCLHVAVNIKLCTFHDAAPNMSFCFVVPRSIWCLGAIV